MTRRIIAAVSRSGVIGVDGGLPWHYPEDLKRFKRLTMGATLIMGRKTWESLPRKPLAGRRNLVITSRAIEGVECFSDIESALASCQGDVWFIGGARLFREALRYAELIDLTVVPDEVDSAGAVSFPEIDLERWQVDDIEPHEGDKRLEHRVYRKRPS